MQTATIHPPAGYCPAPPAHNLCWQTMMSCAVTANTFIYCQKVLEENKIVLYCHLKKSPEACGYPECFLCHGDPQHSGTERASCMHRGIPHVHMYRYGNVNLSSHRFHLSQCKEWLFLLYYIHYTYLKIECNDLNILFY